MLRNIKLSAPSRNRARSSKLHYSDPEHLIFKPTFFLINLSSIFIKVLLDCGHCPLLVWHVSACCVRSKTYSGTFNWKPSDRLQSQHYLTPWAENVCVLTSRRQSAHHISVVIYFPPLVRFTRLPPVPFYVLSVIYIEESFTRIFFLLWIFLKRCPWVKRHIKLTDHVFNDRRDLKSDSAPLSLSQMMQRFYIINQPAFLVLIISRSWNIHKLLTITKKKKKNIWELFAVCVYSCRGCLVSSGLSMSLGVETSRHLEFIRKPCCECSLRTLLCWS